MRDGSDGVTQSLADAEDDTKSSSSPPGLHGTRSKAGVCGLPKVSDGEPCRQSLPCPWHGPDVTPADRALLAKKGGWAARRVLAKDTPLPTFNTRDEILAFVESRAHLVETGELDPRLSAELRGWWRSRCMS
jgi:hypothetical protein